jgi:hypothetical protein
LPLLLALVAGNVGMALADTLIQLAALRCIRHVPRALQRAPSVARFFSAFIVSCDATHMMAILVILVRGTGSKPALGCGGNLALHGISTLVAAGADRQHPEDAL